jgi:hypothetical protein
MRRWAVGTEINLKHLRDLCPQEGVRARKAPRRSIRVTSALKRGVSQTHWEPRPELDIDLNSVTSESRGLGSRRRARWLKAPADRRQIVPLRASLSESFLSRADSYNWGTRRINTSSLVHL